MANGKVAVPAVTPTIGAALGGILSMVAAPAAASVGIPPELTTPVITGFAAWLAHFLHSKLGTPE